MLMKSFLDMVCRKKNDMKLVQMFSHEMLERLSDDSKKKFMLAVEEGVYVVKICLRY